MPDPNEYLVDEARRLRVCRICRQPLPKDTAGLPQGWGTQFGSQVWPERITLNFGKEYAHTDCLDVEETPDA